MVSRRRTEDSESVSKAPATTPKGRENQLINLAINLAEKQIREGTASSQVMTHFLKLGSSREVLEQEKIALENELNAARKQLLEEQAKSEETYNQVLQAMRRYSGVEVPEDDDPNGPHLRAV